MVVPLSTSWTVQCEDFMYVYKESWTPVVYEELKTKQEHGNSTDQFAVCSSV